MISRNHQLDASVEISTDDRGRIVLLPDDDRLPVRVPASDRHLLDILRNGTGPSVDAPAGGDLNEQDRARLSRLIMALDQAGMLAGRPVRPHARRMEFPSLTTAYDRVAHALASPITGWLSIPARGAVLGALALGTLAALGTLWWVSRARMFEAVVTPHWWLGIAAFLIVFPFVHEFSHAFASRLFGLQVSAVGVQSQNGLNWAPFVEVRRAVLSSDPVLRIWIPLAGVLCNLLLTLVASIGVLLAEPGSMGAGVAGTLLVLFHCRVLIDGGPGQNTDASQALRAARELQPGRQSKTLALVVRGSHIIFMACTLLMVALAISG